MSSNRIQLYFSTGHVFSYLILSYMCKVFPTNVPEHDRQDRQSTYVAHPLKDMYRRYIPALNMILWDGTRTSRAHFPHHKSDNHMECLYKANDNQLLLNIYIYIYMLFTLLKHRLDIFWFIFMPNRRETFVQRQNTPQHYTETATRSSMNYTLNLVLQNALICLNRRLDKGWRCIRVKTSATDGQTIYSRVVGRRQTQHVWWGRRAKYVTPSSCVWCGDLLWTVRQTMEWNNSRTRTTL